MASHRIEDFDPATATDEEFRARWELVVELDREGEPENPVTPFDKHRQAMIDQPSFRRPRHWTVWDGDRRAIAYGVLELEYTDTNRHLSWLWIGTRPEARRQGTATALLGRIAEAGDLDGRTMLGGGTIEGSAGDDFCVALGFEKKLTQRKSRLSIDDVDRSMLEAWVARAEERAADYELFGFDDRCPEELLVPFLKLWQVTNTAPRDDLDMEDEVMTPDQLRESEDKALANGDTNWHLVARHRSTGELAGFTQFFFAPYAEDVAWQGWTAVHPAHRDRGLGRWLKAANCLRLMDERPEMRHVDTWNAFSNAPMLGINIEMGFQLLRGYNEWQAPTERLASSVKERSGG
jgi:GNAT superfamily N-acetyltransferase